MDEQTKSQKRTILWVCFIALSLLLAVQTAAGLPFRMSMVIIVAIVLAQTVVFYFLWRFRKR